MKTGARFLVGSLLCGAALLATAGEASAQRGWRIARAIASPWYDLAPPLGPAGNSPWGYWLRYYNTYPTYTYPSYTYPNYTVTTPQPAPSYVSTNIGRSAELKVIVPSDADVFVNGSPIGQRGTTTRTFTTPPLERGWAYSYRVMARVPERGGMVTHERTVSVAEGEQQTVDFNRPDARSEPAPKTPIY